MPSVTVSFTTTPKRLRHIKPMIDSLEKQTFKKFKVILWLCRTYSRSGLILKERDIPSFIKNSMVNIEFCEDFGSNTKLLPTVQAIEDPDAILVTADDDTIYPKKWLEGLVEKTLDNPQCAYGYRGKILKRRTYPLFKNKFQRPFKYDQSQTIALNKPELKQQVDLLTGVWGICYRRSFFNNSYFNLKECRAALHNDDIWANGHLARNQIKRVCIGIEGPFADIDLESQGVQRLWDSVNNGKGLNDQVFRYFKNDFK